MNRKYFTVGGCVQASRGIYIERPEDDELLKNCLEGNFCYGLAPRMVGKSSLMIHTAEHLSQMGITTVIVDLSIFGRDQAEKWFFSFIDAIARRLSLDFDIIAWWNDNAHLTNSHRLNRFFSHIVLEKVASPTVIFIDEIDVTLGLPFSDDFFSSISTMTVEPIFQRLSFVFLGVAMPDELVSNKENTLFQSGCSIKMTYFTLEGVFKLVCVLDISDEKGKDISKWIFKWTNVTPLPNTAALL